MGYYLLGTLDWLDHPDQYQYVDTEKIINDYFWENNYNQLILGNYDWKEKVVLDDAKKIIQKIRNNVFNDEKQLNYRKTKGRIVDSKILFYRDFIREYVSKDAQKGKKREFINSFIKDMKDPEKIWDMIEKIADKIKLRIIKKEPIQKSEDEISLGEVPSKFFVSYDTLFRVIRNFEKLSESQKKKYLKYGQDLNKGGLRKSIQKVSDETILCMIVLVLDFPTLSADSIATYLNS